MKKILWLLILIVLSGILSGEPSLLSLSLGEKKIVAEVAVTWKEKRKGLQKRKALEKDQGMLFVYETPQILSFWMKDTWIPLSIAYISDQGIILQIENMEPRNETPIRSREKCLYALEMNQGWFFENGIQIGTKLCFPENSKFQKLE